MAGRQQNGNSNVRARVQQQARQQTAVVERQPDPTVKLRATLDKMMPQIKAALPKHMSPERMARIVLTTVRINPKLLECTTESLLAAVMQSAQLGLEPGILGHCYFVPFHNKRTGTYEVQFIIGYRGMVDLARRSGNIETIYSQVVYANDLFDLEYGLEPRLSHIPWHVRNDAAPELPGGIRGAYMVAKFVGGGYYLHYMPKAEIDKHRDRSKAADNGPWVTDYEEMCKKTVVRAGWKWLPISIELASKVEAADEEVAPNMSDVIDLSGDQYQVQDESGDGQEPEQNQPEPPPAPELGQGTGPVPTAPSEPQREAEAGSLF